MMAFLIIVALASMLLALLFGKPAVLPDAEPEEEGQWRCVLKGSKAVYFIAAKSETEAIRLLMRNRVDVSKIASLERNP